MRNIFNLYVLVLLAIIGICVPASLNLRGRLHWHHTWTTVQHPTATTCSNNSNACPTTVTSTTAHSLGVLVLLRDANQTVSGITATTCNATWTQVAHIETASRSANEWYCTDMLSGKTSLGPNTWSGTGTTSRTTAFFEYTSSTGSIAVDGTGCATSVTSTNPQAQCAMTVGSTNDVYVGGSKTSGSSFSSCTAGWTAAFPNGDLTIYNINQTSYSAPSCADTNGASNVIVMGAYKEAAAAATNMPVAIF